MEKFGGGLILRAAFSRKDTVYCSSVDRLRRVEVGQPRVHGGAGARLQDGRQRGHRLHLDLSRLCEHTSGRGLAVRFVGATFNADMMGRS